MDYDEDLEEITTINFNHELKATGLVANPKIANQFITSFDDTAALWNISQELGREPFRTEDIRPLEQLAVFPKEHSVNSVIWEGSAKKLLGYSSNRTSIFEITSSNITHQSSLPVGNVDGEINCAAWNPLSDKMVAIGKGTSIVEMDIRSNQKQFEIVNAHEILVRFIDYNQNKPNVLVSGGDDCMVRIWDTRQTKAPIMEISDHSHWIWCVQLNKFHDQLLLTCSSDAQVNLQSVVSVSSNPVRVFSPTTSSEEESDSEATEDGLIKAFEQHEESVYRVAWSPADPWIFASVSYDGRFVVNTVPQEHKYKIIM